MLQAFNRKEGIAGEEKDLQRTIDGFAKACGAKPPVKVEWASFTDADVRDQRGQLLRRAAGRHAAHVRAVERGKEGDLPRREELVCTQGKEMQLDLASGTLTWTTSRGGTNMGDFARKYLEKKL